VSLCDIQVGPILRRVVVDDGIALVVECFRDEPTEDPRAIGWIDDAVSVNPTIDGSDVIRGDHTPMHITVVAGPPFDARELAFDPRPEPSNDMISDGCGIVINRAAGGQDRNEIFDARQHEYVSRVAVPG
jgi:hypothetical protein